MTIFHLVRICTVCQCHQLMSKADGKDRHFTVIQLFDFLYNRSTFLRVSRTIGKHNAVRMICQNLFCCSQCRIYGHLTSTFVQISCNISLGAEIHQCYLWTIALQHIFFLAGYFLYHLSRGISLQLWKHFIEIIILIRGNHTVHSTFLTKDLGQCSGIDACYPRYIMLSQKLLNRSL